MPASFSQGIQFIGDYKDQVRNEIHAVTMNWFVNRCPLMTRLPRIPVGSTTFTVVSRMSRPRTLRLIAAAGAADTTLTFFDSSYLMVGDVIELVSGERVEVIADPNTVTGATSIRRGVEGTTPGTAANNDTVRLAAIAVLVVK